MSEKKNDSTSIPPGSQPKAVYPDDPRLSHAIMITTTQHHNATEWSRDSAFHMNMIDPFCRNQEFAISECFAHSLDCSAWMTKEGMLHLSALRYERYDMDMIDLITITSTLPNLLVTHLLLTLCILVPCTKYSSNGVNGQWQSAALRYEVICTTRYPS